MKPLWCLLLICLAGCIGDRALPHISSTPIPDTEFAIHLDGPDPKGSYHYYVFHTPTSTFTHRLIGPLRREQTEPARLEDLGDGIFRIQWGEGPDAVFAVIDSKKELIIEDSNSANPKDKPFAKRPAPRDGF